jgi:hypothetical protein
MKIKFQPIKCRKKEKGKKMTRPNLNKHVKYASQVKPMKKKKKNSKSNSKRIKFRWMKLKKEKLNVEG